MIKFEVTCIDNAVKIYINDVLHVCIRNNELVGFQSWIIGKTHKKYIIEFYTKTTTITTEYDKIDKWKSILSKLDESQLYTSFSQD